jgi:hypothetical protein
MSELIGVFPLKNCHTGEYEDAELYSPIAQKHIEDFENQWRPLMNERIANISKSESTASANVQDAHWKWREKTNDRNARIDFESFSVECNGVTQGLMFVNSATFSKAPSQLNQFMIYIDLVSTAPWNRPGFTKDRLYKGVGPLLLGTAISYSIEQGFNGRIGLHSLPQSESWYRDECGMTDLGIDYSYPQKLRYFEMTAVQAQTYIRA